MPLSSRRSPQGDPPSIPEPHDLGATDDSLDRMLEWFGQHGDTYRVFAPARNSWTWVVHHPDDVKRVLVTNHRNYTKGVGIDRVRMLLGNGIMTSEGEFWRRQRRMLQPAFHRRVIQRFAGVIRERNEALFERWAAAAGASQPVNLTHAMSELALEVILHAIFSEDLGRLVGDLADNPFMLVTRESKRDPRFAYEFRQLGKVVQRIIRQRRATGRRQFDFTLIDSPAGIEQGFRNSIAGADEVVVVTNPEVSSVRDADRIVGLVEAAELPIPRVIVNRLDPALVRRGDMMSVDDVTEILAIPLLGVVPNDETIITSTNRGEPAALDMASRAGQAFRNIAARLTGEEVPLMQLEEPDGTWRRILRSLGLGGSRNVPVRGGGAS